MIVALGVVFSFLFGFVDAYLDGAFIDWISEQFLNVWNLDEFGISKALAFDAVGAKYFFYRLGLAFIIILVVVSAATAHLYARRRLREDRAATADMLARFMAHDLDAREVFPEGYEDIALEAAHLKEETASRERALADEARRRSDLITYLAHDLKTPLTSVIGYLSLLDEIPEMPEEQRCRYVGIARDKARRLERLINEFFDITRYNLSHIELEVEQVDLGYLLVQMTDELYPQLAAHGNTVELVIDGKQVDAGDDAPPLMIEGDPDRLARVFNNVLKNAIAYSHEGTPIEVDAEVIGGEDSAAAEAAGASDAPTGTDDGAPCARVTIADTGATIPPHRLESIFDKFFRLDETRGTATGGAGLGLAIAREIVALHGGTITAQSAAGRTAFTIELPR